MVPWALLCSVASKVPAGRSLGPPWVLWLGGGIAGLSQASGHVQSPGNECGHGMGPVGRPTLVYPDQVPSGV